MMVRLQLRFYGVETNGVHGINALQRQLLQSVGQAADCQRTGVVNAGEATPALAAGRCADQAEN